MVIARILWGFDITWPKDANGNNIAQDIMKMVYGFMSTPEEFKALFKVRSPKHAKIFRQEWAGMLHLILLANFIAQQKEGIKFVHLKGHK
jgi:hypothetical protein